MIIICLSNRQKVEFLLVSIFWCEKLNHDYQSQTTEFWRMLYNNVVGTFLCVRIFCYFGLILIIFVNWDDDESREVIFTWMFENIFPNEEETGLWLGIWNFDIATTKMLWLDWLQTKTIQAWNTTVVLHGPGYL